MKHRHTLVIVLFVVAGGLVVFGFLWRSRPETATHADAAGDVSAVAEWTCSMHPQIRQPRPGRCPLCGMDLIPASPVAARESENAPVARLSPSAQALAEIVVVPVERRAVPVEIRLSGQVEPDETRVAYIASRVSGRIEKLHVAYEGAEVVAGQPLVDIWSPELISAQQEFMQAAQSPVSTNLIAAVRDRLRWFGLSADQIADLQRTPQLRDTLSLLASIHGVVLQKTVREGEYVKEGTRLFTVADLSAVWVVLNAYESDLPWLKVGEEVELQLDGLPGKRLRGDIWLIEPTVAPHTRTVRVLVSVVNSDRRLRPGMFVRAIVRTQSGAEADHEIPLVIPASAPLITGRRALVYVAAPETKELYEGRNVVLGPRAGDYYIVREGLREGEFVVARGAFKIDSSLQLQGKPSMMTFSDDEREGRRPEEKTPQAHRSIHP